MDSLCSTPWWSTYLRWCSYYGPPPAQVSGAPHEITPQNKVGFWLIIIILYLMIRYMLFSLFIGTKGLVTSHSMLWAKGQVHSKITSTLISEPMKQPETKKYVANNMKEVSTDWSITWLGQGFNVEPCEKVPDDVRKKSSKIWGSKQKKKWCKEEEV